MNNITTENTFETALVQSLIEHGGYTKGNALNFSVELGMFKYEVLKFLQGSQAKKWDKISSIYGADAGHRVIQRLYKELDLGGSLDIFEKILEDKAFGDLVKEIMMKKIYKKMNE